MKLSKQQYTIGELVKLLTTKFIASTTAKLDAELLICHCLNKPISFLYTWPELQLTSNQLANIQQLASRRVAGEPIAYILGSCYFWKFKLIVNQSTLIPRPETELLVEMALDLAATSKKLKVCELGTGSGAIALSLAMEKPNWQIIAVDKNSAALKVAQTNIINYKATNIQLIRANWASSLAAETIDILISNPPYIASQDPHLSLGDVRYEPKYALVAGKDGLDDIKIIANQAREILKPKGWLLLEHGYQQAELIQQILKKLKFTKVSTHKDLANLDRITMAQKPF